MTEPTDGLVLGSTVERYRIDGVLGEGGMARVYRVTHTILNTVHALKVVTLPGRQFRARLVAEGRAQASLRHPNVVGVTDVLELPGGVGLVLEYVPGTTLEDLLARRSLSESQIDHLADGVLRGVAYAHAHGLVHRDLKPSNVLLRVEGKKVTPKVADFGLVKSLGTDDGGTKSGVMMGTPRYMAPEQVESARDVDHRADVFALGAILYAMATGVHAFAPDSQVLIQIIAAVQSGRYRPLRELRPDAPQRWVDAVTAALQVDLATRAASVEELRRLWLGRDDRSEEGDFDALVPPGAEVTDELGAGQTLAPALSGLPVTPAPPTPVPPVAPRRWWPTLLAVGAAAAVGFLTVGSLLALLLVPAALWTTPPPPPPLPLPMPQPQPEPPPPDPAPEPPPAPAPEPPPALRPPPRPPSPAPAPEPLPAPAPAPAPSGATFQLTGARGYLRCGGVDFPPGPVPAGTCAVHAFFGDDPVTVRRDLPVGAGQTVVVTCRPAFRLCDVEVR